jgi:multidrug efflux pump subunit AcrA (membrane-fusion protein)
MQSFPSGAPGPGPVPLGPIIVPPKPTEKRRTRTGAILLAALALAAVLGYFWSTKSGLGAGKGAGSGINVPIVAASLGNVQVIVRVSGTFAAQNSAALLAPRILGSRSGVNRGGDSNFATPPGGGGGGAGGGPGGADFNLVLLSLAKPGSHVKAGDVVGQFDAQNQLLRLDDYKDSVVQLENNLKNMMANLASLKEAHDQSVRSAKADWNKAILDLQTAPIRADIDTEKYKLAVEEAEATYKALVAETSLVEESPRAQVRSSELNRDQSRIELQRAEANVQKMTIKAPMDGIVVMASIVRNGEFGQIREGDQVNAGQPFMYIVDPGSMVLDATVNQVDAESLRLGMKATVHLDAYPDVELSAGHIARPSTISSRGWGRRRASHSAGRWSRPTGPTWRPRGSRPPPSTSGSRRYVN